MSEWLKEVLIAFGGGTTATIAVLLIFKSVAVKIFEKTIDTSFEKSTIKLTNRLERSTKAYEILLTKELDYYSKIDPFIAQLVPLVQDLEYWTNQFIKGNLNSKEKYREHLLHYLEIIPQMKNDIVMFQPYIPVEVFNAVLSLLANAQDKTDLDYLENVGEVMYDKAEGIIDLEKIKPVKEKILKSIALVELCIKNRLTDLVSN